MRSFLGIVVLCLLGSCTSEEVKRDRFFIQGNEALQTRQFDQAIAFYTNAITIDQSFARAFNNRGVAYMEDDHPYEAIQDYNIAIGLEENYTDAIFNRAYAYENVGRLDDALADITEVKRSFPDSGYVYFYEGLLLSKLKDYDRSMERFQKALTYDPNNVETVVNIATLQYFQGELDLAEQTLLSVLESSPNESNALNTLSQVYLLQGKYQEGLQVINMALEINANEPYFLNNRGQLYLALDSLQLAVKDINKSILRDPKNVWAYRNKGIYFLKIGDYDQAIRLFERVTKSAEFVDEVYSYLGESYLAKGDVSSACVQWEKGIVNQEIRSKSLAQLHCN